ncbi:MULTISPECIES: glycosyltransferase [Providencia]|nr:MULTISPECIES: glycosyltransferase [Providencia]APC14027.1 UDP-Gal:alpha-D-GlcNAc-diphosphoundecaprenol beta-1,3-galactosyltransferase [Providencia rettgeri]AVL73316.1 amylovoran biosynthesis protein AmsE [Providencia rettgeri]ELR5212969.1 glycosyltransferase [Providencia rettgeri]ELR5265237.1 glycosyltransferase [Providencia rettgeri]TXM56467.1 glycosyltransferase [Providencia rettgeri]
MELNNSVNFSILMSLYNKEAPNSLHDCLLSIQKNTLTPSEIVLVFDGKINEELNSVVKKFSHLLPIKVIRLSKNLGLGNALNEGLKHCIYDWVFRMDTDDLCSSNRFKKQVNYIKNHSDVTLFGSNTEEFDSSMVTSLGQRRVPINNNEIREYIKRRNPFNHMTVAFRKDVIESVGGYQHHLYMEDYNLWIRVIAAGHQVGNIDEVLVNVRGGDSMVKRRKGLVYIKSELQLAKLKIEKNIDSPIGAYSNFIIRSLPRLLPTYMLSKVYKKLRK